jgi:hypothetical protein
MKPLDQTNRDWSKGNCFYVTLEFIKDSENLRAAGHISKSATVYLVHGLLDSANSKVKHAWVEIDDVAIDHSNNQSIRIPVEIYYSKNSALPSRRFSRAEADALLCALSGKNGNLPIGYWGDLSDEVVKNAMENYQESQGAFASDVCFSDPSDSANHKNLTIDIEPGASPSTIASEPSIEIERRSPSTRP